MDRRGFFRRLSGKERGIRPPGAKPEKSFIEFCNGCGACIKACPEKLIQLNSDKLPIVSFANKGCTFCGQCSAACDQNAFIADIDQEDVWTWRARVSARCLDKNGIVCRACEASCEMNAIKFRPVLGGRTDVSVLLADCNGCGECIASCPSGAIAMFEPEITINTLKENAA